MVVVEVAGRELELELELEEDDDDDETELGDCCDDAVLVIVTVRLGVGACRSSIPSVVVLVVSSAELDSVVVDSIVLVSVVVDSIALDSVELDSILLDPEDDDSVELDAEDSMLDEDDPIVEDEADEDGGSPSVVVMEIVVKLALGGVGSDIKEVIVLKLEPIGPVMVVTEVDRL